MIPRDHVASAGDRPAVIMAGSGQTLTYQQLEDRANQLAHFFLEAGLQTGDTVAVLLENTLRYFEIYWAVQRSGLYMTPINWHVRPAEVAHILADSEASMLITSTEMRDTITALAGELEDIKHRLVIGGALEGFDRYEAALESWPVPPIDNEVEGSLMIYSSGTTGRPKGIRRELSGQPFGAVDPFMVPLIRDRWGGGPDTVYLSPAPMYHMAPLGWTSAVHRLGGTVVVMEKFDAASALDAIDLYKVTLAQFVPTHFVRLLKLPAEQRARFDHSSLRVAVHAAAPCPADVKESMLAWWGLIVHEYYGASEGIGLCAIGPEEWLAHRGSVGRAVVGVVHILDENGVELPAGEQGQIWFETQVKVVYHHDEQRTREATNDRGWVTVGDIGYLDEDDYLYLTDRSTDMVISGGANLFPREAEDVLIMHPAVFDVAVIGVPDAEMGERLLAVVHLLPSVSPSESLARELEDYCRERLGSFKSPKSVEFVDQMPRLPSGKLLKRELRAQYRERFAVAQGTPARS